MNQQLKARIVEKYGTQQKFAQRIDLSPSVVSLVIRSRLVLTGDERLIWAKALGISPENEIFKYVIDERVCK